VRRGAGGGEGGPWGEEGTAPTADEPTTLPSTAPNNQSVALRCVATKTKAGGGLVGPTKAGRAFRRGPQNDPNSLVEGQHRAEAAVKLAHLAGGQRALQHTHRRQGSGSRHVRSAGTCADVASPKATDGPFPSNTSRPAVHPPT